MSLKACIILLEVSKDKSCPTVLLLLENGIVSGNKEQKSDANQPDRPSKRLEEASNMLTGIAALEVIPRVQIQRVQQNMPIVIFELRLLIRTEVDSAKKFTQSICNNFVLTLDGMGIVVEFVNSFSIDFGCLFIAYYLKNIADGIYYELGKVKGFEHKGGTLRVLAQKPKAEGAPLSFLIRHEISSGITDIGFLDPINNGLREE